MPISVINSFDFPLHGLTSSVLFKSCGNESRFGWFSNCWISLLTVSLQFVSSFWTVEWGTPGIPIINVTATGFPVHSTFALMVGGFSRFGIRRILTSILRIPCSITPLQSSCITLSQYKSQVVCWEDRLHVIEFDRTRILFFERASNFTNILHFGELSNYFLYTAILGLSRSYWTSSRSWLSSIGFTAVKNTDCLSFLGLLPPGINPLLNDGVQFTSVLDMVDVLSEVTRKQYSVLQCRINEITSWMSLDCSEIQEMFGRIRVQAALRPFLWSSSFCQESYPSIIGPLRSTIEFCLELFCQVVKSHFSIVFSRSWLVMS